MVHEGSPSLTHKQVLTAQAHEYHPKALDAASLHEAQNEKQDISSRSKARDEITSLIGKARMATPHPRFTNNK